MTKAEINKILKFGKFKDINHFYETHPNQDDEHTQQFMSEYNAYKNGGKIGMKTGGNIKPPKKEISLSGGLFGASKFANKKGGWDSLNDPNSFMTANGKVNYFAPLNKNSNAFFKGSVGTADFLTRLEPENYLQRDNNGNLTYNVAPEGYENENDFIASARLGMQTPQKKKFNRFTDRGEISAGLDYANGNIYPGAGFNYSADYNFRRRNSLPNTQYNKTAGSVGVYGDVNIAPVGIGKEQFENYAGTDSSSEFNQAMRTNLGVKAQYNFPKNGFFVRGNAEVNPLITNFKDGIKTLPNAQLTIGQRFNNGGMMKSRLPKHSNGHVIGKQAAQIAKAYSALGADDPVKSNPYGALYQAAGDVASQSIDTLSPDQNIEGQNYDTTGEIFGKNITKFAGMGAGIGAGFGGFGALIGGGVGALVGTGKSLIENTQNNAQILNAKFQGKAARDRQQRSVTNNDPYGLASSYNISGYADGGEMVPLNSNTEQVEGDEPQLVDGVVKRDDRTGQPVAMVDHNEVIKDGQQVFSDEKKISKKAGLTRTFAKTAEILAKQKGKLETQLEKRGGQDLYTANAIKAVDRQMNTLFGLQERTATQMGLREPEPQQAMAMRGGGNLRGYDNGGPLMPYSIAELDRQNAMKIAEYERMYGSAGRQEHLTYGINPPQKLSSGLPDPLEKQKNEALSDMSNAKTEQEKLKIAQEYYLQNNFNTIPNYVDINARGLAADYSINSGRSLNDMAMAGEGITNENMLKGKTNNPFYPLGYVPGIHTEDNYLKGIEMAKKTTFDKNNNKGYTQQNPNPLWNSDWKQRLEYMKNNLNNNNPSSSDPSDEGPFLERNGFPFEKSDNQPSQIYKGKYDIINPSTSLQPKGNVFMQKQKEARDTYNNPSYQEPGEPGKPERRTYDLDENYLISSLGNLAAAIPFMKYDRERPVFDPNENRTSAYLNNLPTKLNIQANLNEINKQKRFADIQSAQNSPSIAASTSANNLANTLDATNQLYQNKVNAETQLQSQKLTALAQNSSAQGANRQAAINKANQETAMNKGVTQTNYSAVMGKQAENTQKSWNRNQDIKYISQILKYHNIKGGIFKPDELLADDDAVAKVFTAMLDMTPSQQEMFKNTIIKGSSDPAEAARLLEAAGKK